MLDYLSAPRAGILAAMHRVLEERAALFDAVAPGTGEDAARRLDAYTARGKLLRGCLVRTGFELAAGRTATPDESGMLDNAGAAMELFQSGLLIHDDIMDRDSLRRGMPTMHVSWAESLHRDGHMEPEHHGNSLAICEGDLAYFIGFDLLATLPAPQSSIAAVCALAARELSLVGIAQMQDVLNGAMAADTDEEAILRLYRYKTGRYTFSLPLCLGATLAGADTAALDALSLAGEDLGVLFQIKDDELGLFGDTAELGKPVGADIRENKRTLHRQRLFSACPAEHLGRLASIFGNGTPDASDIAFVRERAETLGVRASLADTMRWYGARAMDRMAPLLSGSTLPAALTMRELVTYSLERRS